MVDKVSEILRHDIQEIIKTPELSLSLLKCYSILYISGAAPRACERSHRLYYNKLKRDGMARAEILEKVKTRTCVPAWQGLKYSPIVMRHILPEFVYDEIAIEYLKSGALRESDFTVLPEGYKAKEQVKEVVQEVKAESKKRGPKPKK